MGPYRAIPNQAIQQRHKNEQSNNEVNVWRHKRSACFPHNPQQHAVLPSPSKVSNASVGDCVFAYNNRITGINLCGRSLVNQCRGTPSLHAVRSCDRLLPHMHVSNASVGLDCATFMPAIPERQAKTVCLQKRRFCSRCCGLADVDPCHMLRECCVVGT